MLLDAPTLTGRHVHLEPLSPDHVDGLVAAASIDRSTYDWTAVPGDAASMGRYVDGLLADAREGSVVPFAQRRVADGALVGCTRFMRLESWAGRPWPDEVEVGGTWLAASAQRTPINTEAKYLLFRHAFETWEVHRLCLATDARNQRSRDAIERIGARFEGILRNHRASYAHGEQGTPRDTALFAIIAAEWPGLRTRLEGLLT
jgi:RimJ/RimL family protein N-acetyltransferase